MKHALLISNEGEQRFILMKKHTPYILLPEGISFPYYNHDWLEFSETDTVGVARIYLYSGDSNLQIDKIELNLHIYREIEDGRLLDEPSDRGKIPNTITALSVADKELSGIAKSIKEARKFIKDHLFELLLEEPNEQHQSGNLETRIVRGQIKEFKLDKVLKFFGDIHTITDENGEELALYKPSSKAIAAYAKAKIAANDFSKEESEVYKELFETKSRKAFIVVRENN